MRFQSIRHAALICVPAAVAQGAQAGKVFGSTAQPTEKAAVDEAVGTCAKSTSGCQSVGTFCTTR